MNITSFYPVIASTNLEGSQKDMELLGFHVIHSMDVKGAASHRALVMENDAGCRTDIFYDESVTVDNTYAIRINVDDFDEGVEFFRSRGFTIHGEPVELPAGIVVCMYYEKANLRILIYQHNK